uniref:Uncharacterized protein n=1 Tax=Arundo donax TaxID=35708 RepID=A0A0A9F260_ARUDO
MVALQNVLNTCNENYSAYAVHIRSFGLPFQFVVGYVLKLLLLLEYKFVTLIEAVQSTAQKFSRFTE